MDLSYLEKFKCIGSYTDAETKESFEIVLENVVNKALLNTTVQINLNDTQSKPSETDVTMFLFKAGTSDLKYTFTHTINKFGNPDTLILDHMIDYDLVINTIPKVIKKNISITRNKHNTIDVDAPQGYIKARFTNASRPYQFDLRIMKSGGTRTLNAQKIGAVDKYIVGKYDIEILTLPRIYVQVEVNQSTTSYINVKAPGTFKYSAGKGITGQVFTKNVDGTWDWVANAKDNSRKGQWNLQPGEYKFVYRKKDLKSSVYTVEKPFRINSNNTITIKL